MDYRLSEEDLGYLVDSINLALDMVNLEVNDDTRFKDLGFPGNNGRDVYWLLHFIEADFQISLPATLFPPDFDITFRDLVATIENVLNNPYHPS